jgi:hypothetical protein
MQSMFTHLFTRRPVQRRRKADPQPRMRWY